MIQITCKGNSAICTRTERLTSGMVGLQCKFEFDSAWDGLARTAVFLAGTEKRDVLLTGDTCTVPWEVLKTAGYQLVIGVYGTNAEGTLVIPTVYAMCGGIASGADPSGDESTDPTLPVWGQMQGMIGNLADLETVSKDNLVAAINEAAQSGGGGASVELDTTLSEAGKAADAKAVGDALANVAAAYVITLSTEEADAQANSDAVTAAIAEHGHVVLKAGKYPVKPGIVIDSGKLDMNGAHFYTVDYKSSTPLVYMKGEAPEICNGELEGSYDLADNEEGYSFFESESLIRPEGVNGAYIHHMDMHHNWGYCISPGENVERVYAETATETGNNEFRFTTEAFDIPEGYKYVTAAGSIGYNYIISISDVVYRFYDENGTEITNKRGVPRKRITIPSGAKTVTFDTKPGGDTYVPYYAYFTNYEETLTVADCKLHNFHSLGMANFPGPTTVTRCSFIESGKPRSEANGTARSTTGGIDIEDIQTPEFIMSDCYSRDCKKLLMFGGYKGVISNCVGDKIGIYRGWNCDLSNCNVNELYVLDSGCLVSTNGVHADSLSIKGNAQYNVRGNISINGIPREADVSTELLSRFDSFVVRIKNSWATNGAIAGRLNGRIECTGYEGYRGDGISSEKGSHLEMDVKVADDKRNWSGACSVNGEAYGLVANAAFLPQGHTIYESTFNIDAPTGIYYLNDGMMDGGFKDCVFNLTGSTYFSNRLIDNLTVPIDLTFENCIINNADNYLFNYVPQAGGTVTFKNCTIADESKLFNGDASSMTINIVTGGEGGVDVDASLSVAGAAADAKAVGDALAGKQGSGNYVKFVNGTAPDENGNVEVEGSGGGGDSWELIYYGEITEDIGSVIVDKDSNGNTFSLKEYKLVITTVAAVENPNSGFSWYTHNDDGGTKGPFYTINGAVGGRTLVFDGKLCGNCWWCQYITDNGNTAAQASRSVLCPDGQDSGPSAVPVYKLKLSANSGNTCGAGSKVALFGVRA